MNDAALNPLAGDVDTEVLLTSVPDELEVLEAFLEVLGEKFAALAGTHGTRLTVDLIEGGGTANVESTLLWPDAGKFAISGLLVTYSGKTDSTLTGLAWPAGGSGQTFPRGELIEDATRTFSGVDRARSDMLAVSAEGAWLDVVARFYGERRPWPMTDATFRVLLLVLIYLDRGTWWAVWRVLDKALADFRTTITNGVTAAVTPTRVTSASAPFKAWHVHRYVRIGTKVHRILKVDGAGGWCDLAPGGGPWWSGATFGDATGVTLSILAFVIEEDPTVYPGQVVIHAFPPGSFTNVPPTYLQPAGAAVTPPGVPKGGQVLPDENSPGGAGTQPLYLGGGAGQLIADLLHDVLAHGIRPIVVLGQP